MTDEVDLFNIRELLRKFFLKRPSKDDLYRRGIMKNEPVFGCTLTELQFKSGQNVPEFVQKCIAIVEKEQNIKSEGLYRQSGVLSAIQRV